eukprot:scaffold30948_cov68-Attheya_sp.AAC.1
MDRSISGKGRSTTTRDVGSMRRRVVLYNRKYTFTKKSNPLLQDPIATIAGCGVSINIPTLASSSIWRPTKSGSRSLSSVSHCRTTLYDSVMKRNTGRKLHDEDEVMVLWGYAAL